MGQVCSHHSVNRKHNIESLRGGGCLRGGLRWTAGRGQGLGGGGRLRDGLGRTAGLATGRVGVRVKAFVADCGEGPPALPLVGVGVGVGVRGAVGAFGAVAARPVAGETAVFSCEEETCRKYSHGTLSS